MAVTKIWPVRGKVGSPLTYVADEVKTANPKWISGEFQSLTDVMHYAADADKTEQQFFVTGINCNADTARDQFVTVKKQYGKEDDIVAYHAYQSFREGEVTPEQAHAIGIEFARRVWGERFQVVVATHLNTDHIHNHIVVNSVSFRDGKRCRDKRWYDISKVSDEICRKHGISVEQPKSHGIPIQIAKAERAGKPTRLNQAKAAIDEAIGNCTNLKELKIVLKSMDYECRFDSGRKYWTIRQRDWQRPIRLARIGEDYTNQRILERLKTGREEKPFTLFQRASKPQPKAYLFLTRGDRLKKKGGIKNLYLYYCYRLGYLPKYKRVQRVSPALRDDLLKIDRISEEVRLLCRENINTMEELTRYRSGCQEKMQGLLLQRDEIRKQIRRVMPEEETAKLKEKQSRLTEEIRKVRKEIKMTESIEERSEAMKEKLRESERTEREVKRNELQR